LADEPETTNENQTPSPEDYQALKAELEAERTKAQTLVEQATKELEDKLAAAEQQLGLKTQDSEALTASLKATQEELTAAKAAYSGAVADYKKLVLQTSSLFTADIIWGDTIEDVKASVEKASALVSKIKQGLEAQAKELAEHTTIPAGAPARSGPDVSSMSTTEKINLGLEQARKKKES